MKLYYFALIFSALIFVFGSCSSQKSTNDGSTVIRWDFNDLDGWVDGSQNTAGPENYEIVDGRLRIETLPQSWDRAKVRTVEKTYSSGRYSWRIYVPAMGIGDQASIGAFIYNDDQHELDFEIGYGKSADRNSLQAQEDDLIVFTTCQDSPYYSTKHLIKREQWYTFTIQLKSGRDVQSNYIAEWLIDGNLIEQQSLLFGDEISFYIFCSVENLQFLGDHIPYQVNYALFDYVEYEPE